MDDRKRKLRKIAIVTTIVAIGLLIFNGMDIVDKMVNRVTIENSMAKTIIYLYPIGKEKIEVKEQILFISEHTYDIFYLGEIL